MSRKLAQQERLITERVRALATVYLTRRPDVDTRDGDGDADLDLLVTLHTKGKAGVRHFGVVLKGAWGKVTPGRAEAVLRPDLQRVQGHGPFPFPVVLFLFTMEDGRGWSTWVAEPAVRTDGAPELRQHGEASCRPLDDRAVDDIVDAVDHWYDAFFAKTSPAVAANR